MENDVNDLYEGTTESEEYVSDEDQHNVSRDINDNVIDNV